MHWPALSTAPYRSVALGSPTEALIAHRNSTYLERAVQGLGWQGGAFPLTPSTLSVCEVPATYRPLARAEGWHEECRKLRMDSTDWSSSAAS